MLILETSTERGVIACVDKGNLIFCSQLPFGLKNSQNLLPELNSGLQKASFNISNLTSIVVGIGPGSYTGMRIAATVAKTLGCFLEIPLIPIYSLMTFVPHTFGQFACVIDAKIGGVYVQQGYRNDREVVFEHTPHVLSVEETVVKLLKIPYLITPNASTLIPKLIQARQQLNNHDSWEYEENYPSVTQMALHGLKQLKAGQTICVNELELFYMRKTQAEIERGY